MPVATPGVSTSFTLSSTVSTALANANSTRRYVLIVNNDATNKLFVGFGTANAATTSMIPIPPGGNFELGPEEPASGISQVLLPAGDVAAIAAAGTPVVSYTEW